MTVLFSSFLRCRIAELSALILVTQFSAAHADSIITNGNAKPGPVNSTASFADTGWKPQSITFSSTGGTKGPTLLTEGMNSDVLPESLLKEATISPVPELGTLGMMLTGLAGLGSFIRTRLKRSTDSPVTRD